MKASPKQVKLAKTLYDRFYLSLPEGWHYDDRLVLTLIDMLAFDPHDHDTGVWRLKVLRRRVEEGADIDQISRILRISPTSIEIMIRILGLSEEITTEDLEFYNLTPYELFESPSASIA